MARVIPIEYCEYCREHVPAGHECPSAPPPCPTEAGHPCGTCEACLATQAADLAAREQAVMGSPSDLYP